MNRKKQLNTRDLESVLVSSPIDSLKEIVDDIQERNLIGYLEELFKEKDKNKVYLTKNTYIDRNYIYQIFDKKRKKNPGRNYILQIAIALGCNLEETNRLLTLAKHNQLYSKNSRDAVLISAIGNKLTLNDVYLLLDSHNFDNLDFRSI